MAFMEVPGKERKMKSHKLLGKGYRLYLLKKNSVRREKRSAINYANSMLVYGFYGSVGAGWKTGKPQTPWKIVCIIAF